MRLAIDAIDPTDLLAPSAAFTHGTAVRGAERLVFVSGHPGPSTPRFPRASTHSATGIYSEEWLLEIEGVAVE